MKDPEAALKFFENEVDPVNDPTGKIALSKIDFKAFKGVYFNDKDK